MPKIPPKSFISSSSSSSTNKTGEGAKAIPSYIPIPPIINGMPSASLPLPPLPPLPPFSPMDKGTNYQQFQQFHQQHFTSGSFPIASFIPSPFHPTTDHNNNNNPSTTNENEAMEQGYEEEYEEEEEEEEDFEEDFEDNKPTEENGGNGQGLSFVLSKETIEMFRFSEQYRQKLKEEREQEEQRRLQKEKEEQLRRLKIYKEHNKDYQEHIEEYGHFQLKLMEDYLNEEFKKNNTDELWPILPLNE